MASAAPSVAAQHWVNKETAWNLLHMLRSGNTTELIDAMLGPMQAIVNHCMPAKVVATAIPTGTGAAPSGSSNSGGPQVQYFPLAMLNEFQPVRMLHSYLVHPSRLLAEDKFAAKFAIVMSEVAFAVSWDNKNHPYWQQANHEFMLQWINFHSSIVAWMPKHDKPSMWIKFLTEVVPAMCGTLCNDMEKAGLKMMHGRKERSKSRSHSRSRSRSPKRGRNANSRYPRSPANNQANCPICHRRHDKIARGGCSRCGKANHQPRQCNVRRDVCGVMLDNRSDDKKYIRYV